MNQPMNVEVPAVPQEFSDTFAAQKTHYLAHRNSSHEGAAEAQTEMLRPRPEESP